METIRHELDTDLAQIFLDFSKALSEDVLNKNEIELETTSPSDFNGEVQEISRLIGSIFKVFFQKFRNDSRPSHWESFDRNLKSIELGLSNVLALFSGILVSLNEIVRIDKSNIGDLFNSIKVFMKDLAHMELGLFFVILNKLGINQFPQNFYKITNPGEKFSLKDNLYLDFSDAFYEELDRNITLDSKTGHYTDMAQFDFEDGISSIGFSSKFKAKGCPALYEPVIVNGEQKSLVDATLDWIQSVIEKNLLPSLG